MALLKIKYRSVPFGFLPSTRIQRITRSASLSWLSSNKSKSICVPNPLLFPKPTPLGLCPTNAFNSKNFEMMLPPLGSIKTAMSNPNSSKTKYSSIRFLSLLFLKVSSTASLRMLWKVFSGFFSFHDIGLMIVYHKMHLKLRREQRFKKSLLPEGAVLLGVVEGR